jgi:predicted transcriptional regulator
MKHYRKAPNGVKHLTKTMEELNLSQIQLSKAIGMSSNYVASLISLKEAPLWTVIACEGLKRRKEDSISSILVAHLNVPSSKKEVVTAMLKAMDIPFRVF